MRAVKLYDKERGEWQRFHVGDLWRATRAYRCQVCGCLSNEFHMIPWGPRIVCPGKAALPELHNELHEKVIELRPHRAKHPKVYLDALAEEVQALRENFRGVPPTWSRLRLKKNRPNRADLEKGEGDHARTGDGDSGAPGGGLHRLRLLGTDPGGAGTARSRS